MRRMTENCCKNCKHFIFKLMMNGYHGHCDIPENPIFVRFKDSCEKFERVEREVIPMSDLIDRQAVMDAIDKIKYALWEIDIPFPTVPEYIEHHEQVQFVWELVDKKQKELMTLPSAEPERKKGEWLSSNPTAPMFGYHYCSLCGRRKTSPQDNFCPNCGADMRSNKT